MAGRAIDSEINNSTTTKKSTASRKKKEFVMPSIDMGNEVAPEEGTLNLDATNPTQKSKEMVSMTTGKKLNKAQGERRVADISEMSTGKRKEEGVNIFKSPEDEILKPGGPFDKYKEEKTKEFRERMALEAEKRALADEPDDVNLSTLNEDVDKEEQEILSDSAPVKESEMLRVNAVVRDEEEDESMIDNTETPIEEELEDEDLYYDDDLNTAEDDSEPAPFHATMGDDDYEYPEIGDLPDDVFDEAEEDVVDDEEELEDVPSPDVESNSEALGDDGNGVEESSDIEDDEETVPYVGAKTIAFTTDEESIEDLEKEVEKDSDLPTEDERIEELKAEITRKVKPKAMKLNLSGFTIATKSTASNKIFETKTASVGKWVLPTTGICVQMREISGQKIEYLRENSGSNATAARNALKVLYDHIVTPKPSSLEAWTKSTAYADYDHLYMAVYMAAFSDSNYMPMTCVMEQGKVAKKDTGCGKMFLTDNIDIMKLVKFKDDESKKKFWDLYESDRTNSEGLYASEVVPVSDKFAISFCEPTIYSVMLEAASYGKDFADKYETIIAFIPYIKEIYWIDKKRMNLVPVSYKTYANNASKTAKSKVIRYSNVFDSFSTDEYTNVVSIINAINEKSDWFEYQIPEATCPECGRTIPAENLGAQGLVFTRHRLGILANTSIK